MVVFVNMAVVHEIFHVWHSVTSNILLHLTHTCLIICTTGSLKADFVILFLLAYSWDTSLTFSLIGPDKNIHYFRNIDSISYQQILYINTYHFMINSNTDSCCVCKT